MADSEHSDKLTKARDLQEFFYSTSVAIGALLVSCVLTLMTVLTILRPASFRDYLPLATVTCFCVIATLMLWSKHKQAVHAWAFVAAAVGFATVLSSDFGRREAFYWIERLGIALILFSVAGAILKEATQIQTDNPEVNSAGGREKTGGRVEHP
jgi:drug/metabolite transporter (DMT)-like permease